MRRALAAAAVAGALVAPVSALAAHTPPCGGEDATGTCRWDAATMGNGHGQSFTVYLGGSERVCVRYDNPAVNARQGGCVGPQ